MTSSADGTSKKTCCFVSRVDAKTRSVKMRFTAFAHAGVRTSRATVLKENHEAMQWNDGSRVHGESNEYIRRSRPSKNPFPVISGRTVEVGKTIKIKREISRAQIAGKASVSLGKHTELR